ncbi:MAG: ABC transporter ATP-binding protein, partial [Phototrophicales bacterium]
MSSSLIIQTDALTKVFGRGRRRKVAVNELNLHIEPHQVYGFLGVNGAGKTTTLRMILGLMRPTNGRAYVFGKDIQQHPSVLKRVGAMVEGATFYPYLSGWHNLMVVGRSMNGFDAKIAEQLLEQLGIANAKRVKFRAYSTGMKQRLGIVAALLHNPDLIILDEPTNGMDPAGIREMRHFIRELAHVHGKTVFLTSHLLSEVQATCDRLAIIHQGVLRREGTLDELLNQESVIEAEVSPIERAEAVLQANWRTERFSDNTLHIYATKENTPAIVYQ